MLGQSNFYPSGIPRDHYLYFPIFIKSLVIGFSIAAPVGPIGILCIRRTLADGRQAGFISGIGAATADAFYGAIAAFSLTYISIILVNHSSWLRLGGGIFLIYLGVRTFLASPTEAANNTSNSLDQQDSLSIYFSTFFLTISNPLTILSFTAIFAGLGVTSIQTQDYLAAGLMVLGIFSGSIFWWFLLTYSTSLFKNRITRSTMIWINRIAGAVLIAFGVLALVSLSVSISK